MICNNSDSVDRIPKKSKFKYPSYFEELQTIDLTIRQIYSNKIM